MTAAVKLVVSGERELAADEYREGGALKHRRIPQGAFETLEPDEGNLPRRVLRRGAEAISLGYRTLHVTHK